MSIINKLNAELEFITLYKHTSILISTTAKHTFDFRVFPRRVIEDNAMACFMINDEQLLEDTLQFFDGKVDYIYIDVELKQKINLFEIAQQTVQKSKLIAAKPNDNTLESVDLLIRNQYNDNLLGKKILVIGTGNLAGKIAIRLAERQADVYVKGRSLLKQKEFVNAVNLLLPKFANPIKTLEKDLKENTLDIIVSAISATFEDEDILYPVINSETFIIDVGINNFSNNFIQKVLMQNVNLVRLDTRIALPYQFLSKHDYVEAFFRDVFGRAKISNVPVVSGGFIGEKGSVIVDTIKEPTQIIGIADGRGGVKVNGELGKEERSRIQTIRQSISKTY